MKRTFTKYPSNYVKADRNLANGQTITDDQVDDFMGKLLDNNIPMPNIVGAFAGYFPDMTLSEFAELYLQVAGKKLQGVKQ